MAQDSSPAAAPPLSFVQRVIGVVISPGETMAAIAAAPRWFDVMALTTVLVAAGFALFLSSEVGKAYGRRTFLITSLRPVPPGTEGAVSLEGTLGGLLGGLLVAAYGTYLTLLAFGG